jgi:hypothetical protein
MSYGGNYASSGRGGGSNGYDYGRDSRNYSSGYSNGYDNLWSRYCCEVWRTPLPPVAKPILLTLGDINISTMEGGNIPSLYTSKVVQECILIQ